MAFAFGDHMKLPRISVVVASYNGARTIADCLDGCMQLKYPDYEVIVINDGSTDSRSGALGKLVIIAKAW